MLSQGFKRSEALREVECMFWTSVCLLRAQRHVKGSLGPRMNLVCCDHFGFGLHQYVSCWLGINICAMHSLVSCSQCHCWRCTYLDVPLVSVACWHSWQGSNRQLEMLRRWWRKLYNDRECNDLRKHQFIWQATILGQWSWFVAQVQGGWLSHWLMTQHLLCQALSQPFFINNSVCVNNFPVPYPSAC